MEKISNEYINLSLEKDTEKTPTKGLYYLFKDGHIIASDRNFMRIKNIFDKIVLDNKKLIDEATKGIRESKVENRTIINNWMRTVSNNSLFGGSTIKSAKNKRFSKVR